MEIPATGLNTRARKCYEAAQAFIAGYKAAKGRPPARVHVLPDQYVELRKAFKAKDDNAPLPDELHIGQVLIVPAR